MSLCSTNTDRFDVFLARFRPRLVFWRWVLFGMVIPFVIRGHQLFRLNWVRFIHQHRDLPTLLRHEINAAGGSPLAFQGIEMLHDRRDISRVYDVLVKKIRLTIVNPSTRPKNAVNRRLRHHRTASTAGFFPPYTRRKTAESLSRSIKAQTRRQGEKSVKQAPNQARPLKSEHYGC
jgi:hypothetical protein